MTDLTKNEIIKLYQAGEKIADIKARLNISAQSIYNVLESSERRNKKLEQDCECPFFGTNYYNKIICCIENENIKSITISFDDKNFKNNFKNTFCSGNFKKCKYFEMISNFYSNFGV